MPFSMSGAGSILDFQERLPDRFLVFQACHGDHDEDFGAGILAGFIDVAIQLFALFRNHGYNSLIVACLRELVNTRHRVD